jgi:hypothetical protein
MRDVRRQPESSVSFLIEVVVELLGSAVLELFGGKKRAPPVFAEGQGNASLGAVSAFFGFLSLVFGILLLPAAIFTASYKDMGPVVLCIASGVTALAAFLALRAGRKAPTVTRRNLGLAKFGVIVSTLGLVASILTLVVTAWRIV